MGNLVSLYRTIKWNIFKTDDTHHLLLDKDIDDREDQGFGENYEDYEVYDSDEVYPTWRQIILKKTRHPKYFKVRHN